MDSTPLPTTAMTFKDRADRMATIRQLAEEMGLSETTIKRRKIVGKSLESVQKREETAENARKHREKCEKLAKMVINRQIRAKEAALELGLTMRQLYRWIARIKEKDSVSDR